MTNVDELFSIKKIPDVQISHLFNKSKNDFSIRTFLGFENKFRCLQVFSYLTQFYSDQNKEHFLIDISLMNITQNPEINIKYDMFYLEIQYLSEPSILFSVNFIDSFNFFNDYNDELSTFLMFDNFDDFLYAKQSIKQIHNKDLIIKEIKIVEKEDFLVLFPSLKRDDNLFYAVFRMKNFPKTSLLYLLKNSNFLRSDVISSLNNKKYIVAGYDSIRKRDESLIFLKKLKYSMKLKSYLPPTFQSLSL